MTLCHLEHRLQFFLYFFLFLRRSVRGDERREKTGTEGPAIRVLRPMGRPQSTIIDNGCVHIRRMWPCVGSNKPQEAVFRLTMVDSNDMRLQSSDSCSVHVKLFVQYSAFSFALMNTLLATTKPCISCEISKLVKACFFSIQTKYMAWSLLISCFSFCFFSSQIINNNSKCLKLLVRKICEVAAFCTGDSSRSITNLTTGKVVSVF